jgi:iron complex outermembrane receptor protein
MVIRGARLYLAVLLTSSSVQAFAQPVERSGSDSLNQLQDIVVTARRSEESLMSVPVAVTAISGEAISRAGATNLEKISELAPQVMITRASSGNGGIISIRGLGTPALDAALDQSVSVNIDGVQAGRGNIIAQGFFDLGQVEVLKGPQALFFGKNSPAGVISLRSVNPTDKLEGYVKAGYEFVANQRYGEAAIGGPISDTLKGRIAVRGSKMDGYVKNTAIDLATNPFYPGFPTFAGPKRNGGEELIGRATLVYTPTDSFDATLKVSGGTFKDNGPTSQAYCPGLTLPTVNYVVTVADPAGDCEADNRYQSAGIAPALAATQPGARDGTPFTDTWSTLAALTMNYHFPNLTLTSVTGLMKLRLNQASSFSYSSFGVIYGAVSEDTRTLSQELRLVSDYDGPLNFTLGGFYEDMKRSSEVNIGFLGTVFGPGAGTGKYHSYENLASNEGKTSSAFGQLRWKLMEPLELAAGVRYTHETKDVAAVNSFVHPIQGVVFGLRAQGNPLNIKFSDSNWSPEATLSWKPREGTLVYAAYKTGYKSGGVSNPSRLSAISTNDDLIYKSENSRGVEVGLKSYLADRTVRIEATAYSYLYKNLQVSAFDQLASMSFLTNAASARIKGAELAGEWNPARGLKLNGSATYNIAKYKSFPNAICYLGQTAPTGCVGGQQDLTGRPLTRAPKWTFSGGGSYDTALASSLMLGLNANASYTGKYHTQEDHDPATVQKGFWLLNGGVRLYDQDAGWELSVIGRNLANQYYRKLCNGKFSAGQYSCGYIRAREITVQLGYSF